MSLQGKRIVIGISGSIAAYKAATLIRLFVKEGCEVQVIITPSGKEFITPVTLSALSGKPVICDFFGKADGTWHSHVDLGLWADLMIIAPATASTIGKMANGVADNMLVTTYLSMKAPIFVAPAMDLDMYAHPSTQRNISILKSFGNHIIEPTSGELASHLKGKGRMEDPEKIVVTVKNFFLKSNILCGKKIIITAGPTYEKIDPVRFIGNYSSGKMGFALAEECANRGAEVTLIAGPVSIKTINSNIKRIDVETADQMYEKTTSLFSCMDVAILCAAVADYRPKESVLSKIKREANSAYMLELVANKDIAATLGREKKESQLLIGFALETDDEEKNALSKIKKKNLDFIVLNSLKDASAGFQFDTNKIAIINREGKRMDFSLKSKADVAKDIIDYTISTNNLD